MNQFFSKITVVLLSLYGNTAVFGMESNRKLIIPSKKSIVCSQKEIIFPSEVMYTLAARGNDGAKNKLQQTCHLYKKEFSRDNATFLLHPSFETSQQNRDDIIRSAVWFNKKYQADILEKWKVKKVNVSMMGFTEKFYSIDQIKALRNKHNNTNDITEDKHWRAEDKHLRNEVLLALYCATLCNDLMAAHNISLRVQRYINYQDRLAIKMNHHLLAPVIKKDNEDMFIVLMKNDPFKALNRYFISPTPKDSLPPLLNHLEQIDYVDQERKEKYINLCKKYGGKTLNELEEEEEDRQNEDGCIIS